MWLAAHYDRPAGSYHPRCDISTNKMERVIRSRPKLLESAQLPPGNDKKAWASPDPCRLFDEPPPETAGI